MSVNNLGKAGELYVSTDQGVWHSSDYGQTVVQLQGGLTQAWGISVGAPKVAGGTPSVFVAAVVNGVTGLFRTDNNGGSWTRKQLCPSWIDPLYTYRLCLQTSMTLLTVLQAYPT